MVYAQAKYHFSYPAQGRRAPSHPVEALLRPVAALFRPAADF